MLMMLVSAAIRDEGRRITETDSCVQSTIFVAEQSKKISRCLSCFVRMRILRRLVYLIRSWSGYVTLHITLA